MTSPSDRTRGCFNRILIPVLVILSSVSILLGEKTDVVYLERGDRLTVEIKKLEKGKLTVSTHEMGSVNIEWDEILRIASSHRFQIELENGDRYFGALLPSEEDRKMIVSGDAETHTFDMSSVVSMDRFKKTFLRRLQISIDVGFSYAKAKKDLTWNLQAGLRSQTKRSETNIDAMSYLADQENLDQTTRNLLQVVHFTRLKKNGFLSFMASGEENQELDLNLRILAGVGFGYAIVKNNMIQLTLSGGVAESTERYAEVDDSQWNTELMFAMRFETFKFAGLEKFNRSTLIVFPSLTTSGRVRITFNTQLRIEVFKDFYWGLTFFDNFDSKPPGGGEKNDFGVSTSIGWSRD